MVALARAAHPREACGLLVGHGAAITGLAPTANLAATEDAFEIDTAAQLRLQRRLRGTGRAIIGVWHSHPRGGAEPSARDLAGAWDAGLVWLITAGGQTRAFAPAPGGFRPLDLALI